MSGRGRWLVRVVSSELGVWVRVRVRGCRVRGEALIVMRLKLIMVQPEVMVGLLRVTFDGLVVCVMSWLNE